MRLQRGDWLPREDSKHELLGKYVFFEETRDGGILHCPFLIWGVSCASMALDLDTMCTWFLWGVFSIFLFFSVFFSFFYMHGNPAVCLFLDPSSLFYLDNFVTVDRAFF